MRTAHRLLALFVSLLATTAFCAGAQGAIVTIGSPLNGPFMPSFCFGVPCTTFTTSLAAPAAKAASPISGVVIRWRILLGQPPFKYTLRVGTPNGLLLTGAGSSAPVVPAGTGVETFATNLPIQVGQVVGLNLEANAPIGFIEGGSSTYAFFQPPLADGETRSSMGFLNGEVAFNADVQPRPTIAALSPASGSFKGGSKVTIVGTDFAGATSVTFGSVPAASFTVDSEAQITAVAPAVPEPTQLPVTVTTLAGSATSATAFSAIGCKVPRLKGMKLKAAKKLLRKANCRVGKVKKTEGATAKTGKVSKQKPGPGALRIPGARVKVTLAP